MTEFQGPIVEGAYYERAGKVVGPAQQCEPGTWWIGGHLYRDSDNGEHCAHPSNRLTRRVYITHTDPAEVVAELKRRAVLHAMQSGGETNAYDYAADLVAEKLVGGK